MDRDRKIAQAFEKGASLAALSVAWGLSATEVNRIAREQLGEARYATVSQKRLRAQSKTAGRRRRSPMRQRKLSHCAVCGVELDPGRKVTCNAEHSDVWRRRRYTIDPAERQQHRIQRARMVLAAPDKYADRVEWARAVLSGNPPPFHTKGAQRRPKRKADESQAA